MKTLLTLLLAFALWGAYNGFTSRERKHPPGQIAPDAPLQRNIENGHSFTVKDFTLTPRASFLLVARVLGSEHYRSDPGASLMPIDIAFGWGPMSDSALLNQLKVSQSNRFFFWRYDNEAPASHDIIIRSSANMHLIPADSDVEKMLFKARVGDVVELEGELVDVKRSTGWYVNTSLVRDDSGAGACEVIYVKSARIKMR
jgi:hypothetical protein